MAALGKLVVNMSANITEFSSAMSKAAYTADSKMKAISGAAKVAGGIIGTALVAGAAGLANEIRKMIDAADELGKTAQKVGVSTEALSGFQYAAQLSGLSAESLSASLIKLNKAAADGNKGLDAMGISAKNADGSLKATDQLLIEVADKFSKYEDGAAKSALALQVFGKAGAEMLPFLNLGAEGLAKMQKEAEALGIVIGGKASAQAEAFNDNLTRLSMVKKGIVNQITTAMLPSLVNLSDALFNSAANTDVFKKIGDLLAGTLKVLASALVVVYGNLEAVAMGFIALWRAAEQGIKGNFRAAIAELDKGGKDMVKSMKDAFASVEIIWKEAEAAGNEAAKKGGLAAPLVKSAEEAEKAKEKIDAVLKGLVDEYGKLKYTKEELVMQELRALGATEAQIQAAKRQLDAIKGLTDAKAAEAAATERITQRNQALVELAGEYDRLRDQTATTEEKILRDTEKLLDLKTRLIAAGYDEVEVTNRVAKAIDGLADKYKKTKSIAEEFGGAISSAFEKAIVDGKNFSAILKGIERDIIQIVTRQLVTKPFGEAIAKMAEGFTKPSTGTTGTASAGTAAGTTTQAGLAAATASVMESVKSFFGQIFNGGLIQQIISMITSAFSGLGSLLSGGASFFSSFGGFFADGGNLGAGQWGIAGEAGPEIIHGPATITPMTGGSSPVNVSNVFYLQQPADRRTQQQIAAKAGMSVQRAIARNT